LTKEAGSRTLAHYLLPPSTPPTFKPFQPFQSFNRFAPFKTFAAKRRFNVQRFNTDARSSRSKSPESYRRVQPLSFDFASRRSGQALSSKRSSAFTLLVIAVPSFGRIQDGHSHQLLAAIAQQNSFVIQKLSVAFCGRLRLT
jgi:hypothetical protein